MQNFITQMFAWVIRCVFTVGEFFLMPSSFDSNTWVLCMQMDCQLLCLNLAHGFIFHISSRFSFDLSMNFFFFFSSI